MKTDAPRGVWLVANSPLSWPYPCRCHERGPCTNRCPCRGRPDTHHLPPQCCGRIRTKSAARTLRKYMTADQLAELARLLTQGGDI